MIKSIVELHHFIMSMVLGYMLVPSPALPTPWMIGNWELRRAGD